ncbi:hypothetical protein SK128_000842, partial [Halocaridina rubra]
MSKKENREDCDYEDKLSTSSNRDVGSSTGVSGTKRKMSKKYPQHFRGEWLADPEMKSWLAINKNYPTNQSAFCKMCCCTLNPKLSVLQYHMKSKKHRARTESAQGSNK